MNLKDLEEMQVELIPIPLRGMNLYVPSQFINSLRYTNRVHTLGFDLPLDLQLAINKYLGLRGSDRIRFNKIEIDPNLVEETKAEIKTSIPDISAEQLEYSAIRHIRLYKLNTNPNTLVLYFGKGLGTTQDIPGSDNNLLDSCNVNAWLYWGAVEFNKQVTEDPVKALRNLSKDSSKIAARLSRKGMELKVNTVPVIDENTNHLDKLVYRCFVNRVPFDKPLLVYLVLITLLWNACVTPTGKRVNPAGPTRRMLQGAVDRPLREDLETGLVEEMDTETTVEWWYPSSYYHRSPVALRGQPLRVTHSTLTFRDNRFIWGPDPNGCSVNNSHLNKNSIIMSLPGAQSKLEKISNRCTLFFANRVEVCQKVKTKGKEEVKVVEHVSPLKFAGQQDGFVFTHYQGKYSLAESCIGMYVYKETQSNLLNYEVEGEIEIVQGITVPTQDTLVQELAKELGIDLDDDDSIDPDFDVSDLYI